MIYDIFLKSCLNHRTIKMSSRCPWLLKHKILNQLSLDGCLMRNRQVTNGLDAKGRVPAWLLGSGELEVGLRSIRNTLHTQVT